MITLTGLCRFRVKGEISNRLPYRQAQVDYLPFEADLKPLADDDGFDRIRFLGALKAYLERHALDVDWDTAKSAPAEALVNSLSMALPFEPAERQALLEAVSFPDRRDVLVTLMEIDAADRSGDDDPRWLQ